MGIPGWENSTKWRKQHSPVGLQGAVYGWNKEYMWGEGVGWDGERKR